MGKYSDGNHTKNKDCRQCCQDPEGYSKKITNKVLGNTNNGNHFNVGRPSKGCQQYNNMQQ